MILTDKKLIYYNYINTIHNYTMDLSETLMNKNTQALLELPIVKTLSKKVKKLEKKNKKLERKNSDLQDVIVVLTGLLKQQSCCDDCPLKQEDDTLLPPKITLEDLDTNSEIEFVPPPTIKKENIVYEIEENENITVNEDWDYNAIKKNIGLNSVNYKQIKEEEDDIIYTDDGETVLSKKLMKTTDKNEEKYVGSENMVGLYKEEEEEEEAEEEEEEEAEEEEEEAEEEEEEVEEEEEEAEEEEEEEEEEEVEEYIIEGKKYYVSDTKNGNIYLIDEDEEVGDLVGKIVNGISKFK